MKITIAPGRYVIAVSGGVDSMVLLDLVAQQPNLQLIVAHFDHGVRTDSVEDRKLVQVAAEGYGLAFVYEEGHLQPNVSEDVARHARYTFLHKVRQEQGAQAIIMAHHQGDVIETMLLNLIRGTGRRGLSSLRSTSEIVRPLLDNTKNELQQYAQERGITWHEDSTNNDMRYLRNYLRRHVVPCLSSTEYNELLRIYQRSGILNTLINEQVTMLLANAVVEGKAISRNWFIMLPHAIAQEVMVAHLRQQAVKNIDKRLILRLVTAVKTARPHTFYDIDAAQILEVSKKTFQIKLRHS